MKTKSWTKWVTLACLTASSAVMAGGKEAGNGGGAVVCLQADGSIHAELLDLREGQQKGLKILRSGDSVDAQLSSALDRFAVDAPEVVAMMREELRDLDSRTDELPADSDEQLVPPSDTGLKFMRRERNCSLQGVANYDDSVNRLTVDPVIRNAMGPTDQAALKFHEALYKVMRKNGPRVRTSKEVRDVTAGIFSEEGLRSVAGSSGLENATLRCESAQKQDEFYVIPLNNGGYQVQLTRLKGMSVWNKTTFEVAPDHALAPKLNEKLRKETRDFDEERDIPADAKKDSDWYKGNSWWSRWAGGEWGNATKTYEGIFATQSQYFRPINIYFSTMDLKDQYPHGSSGHLYIGDPQKLSKNHLIRMGIDAQEHWVGGQYNLYRVTTELTCEDLK